MIRLKFTISFFILVCLLSACLPQPLYLVKDPQSKIIRNYDIQEVCLNKAIYEVEAGAPPLAKEEKAALEGADTEYFLKWLSLSGPVPVVNEKGQISEAQSAFPVNSIYKKNVSERYVLCLLNNGYMWPDELRGNKKLKEKN